MLVTKTEGYVESFVPFYYILLGNFKGCLAKILQIDISCYL